MHFIALLHKRPQKAPFSAKKKNFIALLCWCLREASRKEVVPKNASCGAACNMVFENWFSKRLKAHGCFYCKA